MKNLAIIPARGGSKRLPRKNLLDLGGKPLVLHTIEAVVQSGLFHDILLSSDDSEILDIGQYVSGVTLDQRESCLAGDKVKVIDLVKQIISRPLYDSGYDRVGLFLPTCPFRNQGHISQGFHMLGKEDFSVVSVTEMIEPVQLSLTLSQKNIIDPEVLIRPSPLVTGQTRSQDFAKFYRVNGGFYISRINELRKKDNFFQGQVKGCPMDTNCSVDIDERLDLEWAQFLLDKGYLNQQ